MTLDETTHELAQLTAACEGAVLGQGDEGFAEACAGWNLTWTQRPAVVVRAAAESDVVHAVRYAVERGLSVAVQNTGHGMTVPADADSLLVRTTDLDMVRIDPQARTATVGAGSAWTPVLVTAQEHGLAPLLGSAPHTGAVGYSLGGGFGWLARKHGLAVDSIRSLRVVTADGQIRTTSPTVEPELFWALCGTAGGALAVVLEMTIDLAPVAEVYAGDLFYPLDAAKEIFERYLDWSAGAPLELTSAFTLMSFPPLEMVPEPLRAKTFAIVRGCYAPSSDDGVQAGADLIDQWRQWREPLMDTWAPMPFARSAEISMDPVDPVPAISSGRWMSSLEPSAVQVMLDAVVGGSSPSPMLFAEARHAGGAVQRTNETVSYAARNGTWLLEFVGLVTAPGADADLEARFEAAWRQLAPHLAELNGYLNFTEGHEQVSISRDAFDRATSTRLAAAKHRYDPDNVLRHGIPLAELA